jgi:hypothetical protein
VTFPFVWLVKFRILSSITRKFWQLPKSRTFTSRLTWGTKFWKRKDVYDWKKTLNHTFDNEEKIKTWKNDHWWHNILKWHYAHFFHCQVELNYIIHMYLKKLTDIMVTNWPTSGNWKMFKIKYHFSCLNYKKTAPLFFYKLNITGNFRRIFTEFFLRYESYLSLTWINYKTERNYVKNVNLFWLSTVHSLYTLGWA